MVFGHLFLILFVNLVNSFNLNELKFNYSNYTEVYGPLKKENQESLKEMMIYLQNKISDLNSMKKSQNEFLKNGNNHTDSFVCKACLWSFNHVHDIISKYYGKIGLFEFADFICHNFMKMTKEACHGYIFDYGPVILDSLIEHYLTGEYICTFIHLCKNDHFVYLDADEYARNLLKDKPLNLKIPKINKNLGKLWKAVHVSDIHTDLKYTVGSVAECPDPFCCRSTSMKDSKKDVKEEKAGKWGYVGKCDLPFTTLKNFVEQVTNLIKPDFMIWTGDNPSHSEWERETANEILEVTSEFTKLMMDSDIQVYPSLGNHEKYPSDQFYPFGQGREDEALKFFGNLWHKWLGDEAYNEFIKFGYYSKKHLDTNLRIISYNCFYCDVFNFFLIKNPTDPSNQIEWLEKTLRKAEQENEDVYLIGHIPSGDTSLLSECAKRHLALIDRFSHIIRGQFGGHTHNDEVKIMRDYFNKDKVNSIVYIVPSLTT